MPDKIFVMVNPAGQMLNIQMNYQTDHSAFGDVLLTACETEEDLKEAADIVHESGEIVPYFKSVDCEYQVCVDRGYLAPLFHQCNNWKDVERLVEHYTDFHYPVVINKREVSKWEATNVHI